MLKKFILLIGLLWSVIGLSFTAVSVSAETQMSFTVDSTLDDVDVNIGDGICATVDETCTLRAAIQEANVSATQTITIHVPTGVYELTQIGAQDDTASTGDLDLLANLVIQGAGQAKTIIDGMASDRIFHAVVDSNVTIRDLTVQNGNSQVVAESGGGIFNEGNMLLERVTVQNNDAWNGGGIFNNIGTLTMRDSLVQRNDSYTSVGSGLLNDNLGHVEIYDSIFQNNLRGSAIHNVNATAVLDTLAITNNQNDGITNLGRGGIAVLNTTVQSNGGSGIDNDHILVMKNSEVSHNEQIGLVNSGLAEIQASRVMSNTSRGVTNVATLILRESTVGYNNPNCYLQLGGGVYNQNTAMIQRSTIHDNCGSQGGGLYTFNGHMHISNSTISHNYSLREGAVYLYTDPNSTFSLVNSTVAYNQAQDENAGLYVRSDRSDIFIGHSVLSNNTVDTTANDCISNVPLPLIAPMLVQNNGNCTFEGQVLTADPLLEPLAEYGGGTFTHALPANSPAIDAGALGTCVDHEGTNLSVDQTGNWRVLDGDGDGTAVCDLGAYEYGTPPEVPISTYLPLVQKEGQTDDDLIPTSSSAVISQKPETSDTMTMVAFLGGGLLLGLFVFGGRKED